MRKYEADPIKPNTPHPIKIPAANSYDLKLWKFAASFEFKELETTLRSRFLNDIFKLLVKRNAMKIMIEAGISVDVMSEIMWSACRRSLECW